jgi:hypothetical protein
VLILVSPLFYSPGSSSSNLRSAVGPLSNEYYVSRVRISFSISIKPRCLALLGALSTSTGGGRTGLPADRLVLSRARRRRKRAECYFLTTRVGPAEWRPSSRRRITW